VGAGREERDAPSVYAKALRRAEQTVVAVEAAAVAVMVGDAIPRKKGKRTYQLFSVGVDVQTTETEEGSEEVAPREAAQDAKTEAGVTGGVFKGVVARERSVERGAGGRRGR